MSADASIKRRASRLRRPPGFSPARPWAAAMLATALATSACSVRTPAEPECPPFEPVPLSGLSMEAAREAHRRAEVRRHLRFAEALEPGHTLRLTARMVPNAQTVCFADVYEAGRLLFEHEYSFADGLGAQDARDRAAGPFRRVHEGERGGPETISCTSCHWRGGPGGSGALQDNSFLRGDGDRPESADARNPPALWGAGVVQALAAEMTAELAAIRAELMERADAQGTDVEAPLNTKGVSFGVLRVTADGQVDTSGVEGVDADLVIRPFGWKGNFATVRDFIAESLQVHMGIQSDELVAHHAEHPIPNMVGRGADPADPDGDGMTRELTQGQLTALVVYVASLGVPVTGPPEPTPPMEPRAPGLLPLVPLRFENPWLRGRQLFDKIGCANCHTPMMVLKNSHFVTRGRDNSEYAIDLAAQAEHPRLIPDESQGGYPVWIFSDFKRHDLGEENAARHEQRGVAPSMYLTRRLWGLANTSPYFYDGRAPWVDDAILAHGGEAALVREDFVALDHNDKAALRLFLMSMRRAPRVHIP